MTNEIMTFIIKICGMGDTAIMHQLAKLPVDMLGFIFYPRSPRYVPGKIEPDELAALPANIAKTGVFVNEEERTIEQLAEQYHLDTLQLHGSETPEMCQKFKAKGFRIIKAFNLSKNNDFEAYAPHCDYFLFDTPSEKHGGTGAKFDWSLLDTYQGNVPFLLSGGIGPNDAEEVLNINHPKLAGIDINSKFETEPGFKDIDQIKEFLQYFPPSPLKGEQDTTYNASHMHHGTSPILFGFAKQMRANPTDAEEFLWKQLTSKDFKHWRFRRQHPISYFIADFYCHKAKLIIEVDGGYHKIPKHYQYDSNRDHELEEFDLKVLRFTNEQVLFDIEITLQKIEKEVKQRIHP
jgi:phosphoribosylanthranilate isomerase